MAFQAPAVHLMASILEQARVFCSLLPPLVGQPPLLLLQAHVALAAAAEVLPGQEKVAISLLPGYSGYRLLH